MKFAYDHNLVILRKALKQIRKRFPEEEMEADLLTVKDDLTGESGYVSSFTITGDYGIVGTIGWHGDGFWVITDITFEEE